MCDRDLDNLFCYLCNIVHIEHWVCYDLSFRSACGASSVYSVLAGDGRMLQSHAIRLSTTIPVCFLNRTGQDFSLVM